MQEQTTTPQTQNQVPIPGSVASLVFGIISVVLCWYFWFPIAGIILNILCLIFAIIAMNKGKKAIGMFEQTPDNYKRGSLGVAKAGKIIGLVGIILNSIFLLLAVIFTIIGGAALANL